MSDRTAGPVPRRSIGRRPAALLLGIVALTLAACSATIDPETVEGHAEVLEVFTPYTDTDADAFREVLGAFNEQSGIEVRQVGSAAFAERLRERLRDGDPPAVALVPQPSVVGELARQRRLVAFDDEELFGPGGPRFVRGGGDIGVVDGQRVGVWFRLSVKSLVWYAPGAFRDARHAIPDTWEETLALSTQIEDDGGVPWCMGMEAFGSTGWVGTDWIEDLVLRLHGPQVYDAWAAGEVPFTDRRIREAFEAFGRIALTEGRVLGGRRAILSTPALEAIQPLLDDPPGCLLSRQASLQAGDLPEGTEIGADGDVDVFVLPGAGELDESDGVTDPQGPPIVAAGDVAVAFDASDDTRALLTYLADPASGAVWARRGGFTSPRADFDVSAYVSTLDRRVADLVADAAVVRFDASDQMPPGSARGPSGPAWSTTSRGSRCRPFWSASRTATAATRADAGRGRHGRLWLGSAAVSRDIMIPDHIPR